MLIRKNISYLYIFCAFLLGCVDPFAVPSSISSDGILVVEGRIGDEETLIRLSRTANLDSFSINPEISAIVQIENEQGNVVGQLNEVEAGSYSLAINLPTNENYRIRIQTTNDEVYESNYETLALTPPISDLSLKVDSTGQLEILLSTEDPTNNTRYYLWDYAETYEYSAPFTSLLQYDGAEVINRDRNSDDQITLCWRTEFSSDILLQSSVQFEQDIVSERPIVSYTIGETPKFLRAYSILVNQYALTADEFQFWSLLEKNTESLGTLFDPQPSQLITNIQCTSDPQKGVIGYVGASSKTEMRFFVRNEDIPISLRSREVVKFFCEVEIISLAQVDELSRLFSDGDFVPIELVPTGGDIPNVSYTTRFCADCREQQGQGTNIRPGFWF